MKHLLVKYKDPETNFMVRAFGVLYKQNEDFLVIYSLWVDEEFSWSSRFIFTVIPRKYVVETFSLNET